MKPLALGFLLVAIGAASHSILDLDPEWLYWILGVVATVLTASVEIWRQKNHGLDLDREISLRVTEQTADLRVEVEILKLKVDQLGSDSEG